MAPPKAERPKRKKPKERKPAIDYKTRYCYEPLEIGRTKQFVKFPNLDFRKKVAIARRLLHFNYVNEKRGHARYYEINKTSMKRWERELKKRKEVNMSVRFGCDSFHDRLMRTPKDQEEIKKNEKAHGIYSVDSYLNSNGVRPNSFPKFKHFVETYSNEVLWEGGGGVGSGLDIFKMLPCYASQNAQEEEQNEETDVRKTDKWQTSNWQTSIFKDCFSPEVQEIINNLRMVGMSRSHLRLQPPLAVFFLETLRSAFFMQDWVKVAQCIEGICHEASFSGTGSKRHWIFWNAGFYSLMRFEEETKTQIKVVKEFAKNFAGMFSPTCYPRRLGNEICIWMTQEGFFKEGFEFLEEVETTMIKRKGRQFSRATFSKSFNPKRDLIDLMTNLIKAVFLYSIWKRDFDAHTEDEFHGTEDDLRRSGENALSAFEGLLELIEDCEADVTTFMNPLVELTVMYRSVDRAKELLKGFVLKYYGNAFIEEAYVNFLREYFPDSEEEVVTRLKLVSKFNFENPPTHWIQQSRDIATFRKKKNLAVPKKKYFKMLHNPGFSID